MNITGTHMDESFALTKFIKRTQANACLVCYYFSDASINKFNIPGSRQRIARALHSNNPKVNAQHLQYSSLSHMQNSNNSDFAFKFG